MSKNRKKQSASAQLGVALKALLLCAALGAAGIGYVGLKNQLYDLSKQIEQKEKKLKALRADNAKMGKHVAMLLTPQSLHNKIQELNLGLQPPQPSQIVRLPEPVFVPLPVESSIDTGGDIQYASGDALSSQVNR